MRIALDLDGVLADLQGAMMEHTRYDPEDFDQWAKPDYNFFMSEASRVWEEHLHDIEPVEPALSEKTAVLASDHDVNIVTNTAGPNDAIEEWLDIHGVVYEDIVRPYSLGCDKHDLDYDVYIDDKPSMAGLVDIQYLRDQPWNKHIRGQPRSGSGPYFYHSYEPSYIEREGYPKSPFKLRGSYVIRIESIMHAYSDLHRHRTS